MPGHTNSGQTAKRQRLVLRFEGLHTAINAIKQYLAAIGRKGGQKSRRKLTKAQARAMVRARTANRAALRPNAELSDSRPL